MSDKLLDDLRLIEKYADNFVTHWMEDDGNDAEDKARCEETSENIAGAGTAIARALEASRVMLATLETLLVDLKWQKHDFPNAVALRAAIAAAKAAGIVAGEK